MRHAAEDERKDEGVRERLEDRPGGAEKALLVADLQLPLGNEVQELPVVPELREAEAAPAARRPDDDLRRVGRDHRGHGDTHAAARLSMWKA